METIRYGSFETNSSSTHCLTVTNEERHDSAFPKINPDGSIDIETKHYWQCDGECDTVVLAEIIEYICMLGEACEQNLDSYHLSTGDTPNLATFPAMFQKEVETPWANFRPSRSDELSWVFLTCCL